MRFQHMLCLVAGGVLLSGCGVGTAIKHNVQGTHYLQTKNYERGVEVFQGELAEDRNNPQSNYYLGRFYLAEKKPEKALPYLQRAVKQDPRDTDYLFWQGVALGELGRLDQERRVYEKVLKIKKKDLQALVYLGHNQLKRGRFETSLATYQKVLKIWPYSPSALYNRALIAKHLKRTPEEKAGWLSYLSVYPSGALAIRATNHLNLLGDFSYCNHHLGARTITLTKIWFAPFTAEILPGTKPSLDVVGATAVNMNQGKLQIVVHLKNDPKLARARAVALRKYLLKKFPELRVRGIGVSWFKTPEIVRIQRKKIKNPDAVRFFLTGVHPKALQKHPKTLRDRKKKKVSGK